MSNIRISIIRLTISWILFLNATSVSHATMRTQVEKDVEGYAIATCLTLQKDSDYLKDQGYGWADIIVQRGHGGLDAFDALAAAVKSEVENHPVPSITPDGPQKPKAMPVYYCAEIIDQPQIRKSIDQTIKALKPHYR